MPLANEPVTKKHADDELGPGCIPDELLERVSKGVLLEYVLQEFARRDRLIYGRCTPASLVQLGKPPSLEQFARLGGPSLAHLRGVQKDSPMPRTID